MIDILIFVKITYLCFGKFESHFTRAIQELLLGQLKCVTKPLLSDKKGMIDK